MKRTLTFLVLFIPFLSFSQKHKSIYEFALQIPDSISENPKNLAIYIRTKYPSDENFVRALYVWTTNNIVYNKELVDSISHFDLVKYALTTKSGKCKHYSAIITSLSNMVGIEAYSVLGYVRINGEEITDKDHAWNIIKINGEYYLFDPTWDVANASTEYLYFMKDAKFFIKTHMPYDPMMQLLDYPIAHKAFFKSKKKGKEHFDFRIAFFEYNLLTDKEGLMKMLERAENNGLDIPELQFLRQRLMAFVYLNTFEK